MANFTQAAESRIPVATLPPLILAALAQLSWALAAQIWLPILLYPWGVYVHWDAILPWKHRENYRMWWVLGQVHYRLRCLWFCHTLEIRFQGPSCQATASWCTYLLSLFQELLALVMWLAEMVDLLTIDKFTIVEPDRLRVSKHFWWR